jgi:acetyl-CoA carboxylase biotin carboxyl carrier protein
MNQKELKELIEFLIEKDIAEFELERGDVKVRIKRAANAGVAPAETRYVHVAPAPSALPAEYSPAPPVPTPAPPVPGTPVNNAQPVEYGQVLFLIRPQT